MIIINKNGFFYLSHSFRKDNKVINREKYIGKTIPNNIEEIKEEFFRQCLQESLFKKLSIIKDNFKQEWKKYPDSIKKKTIIQLAIEFTYNTNAIEGSTITLEETEDLIKRKISPNKSINDVQETIKHTKLFFNVINKKKELSHSLILQWHKELFDLTKPDISGELREYFVKVGDYRAPDWQDVPKLLKDFFQWYKLKKKIMHPIELAARTHYKFEKIHPFGDGNGRIGRLIIIYILRKAGFPLITIEYKNRNSYYHSLQKTENKFLQYFIRRYLSINKKYLKKT